MNITKKILKHFLDQNREEIFKNSIKHCHAFGVHSIPFFGKDYRVFIALPNHKLYMTKKNKFPVAFHTHHCDIRIECLTGSLLNMNLEYIGILADRHIVFDSYIFKSQINTGKGEFHNRHEKYTRCTCGELLETNDSIYLKAREFHTIRLLKGQRCAWLVEEREEDKGYIPICMTTENVNLEKFNFGKLYKKMDRKTFDECLVTIFGEK